MLIELVFIESDFCRFAGESKKIEFSFKDNPYRIIISV
jgi:hypothetical protein